MSKLVTLIGLLSILLFSCSKNSNERANATDSLEVAVEITTEQSAAKPDMTEQYQFKGKQLLEFEHFVRQLDQSDADNVGIATSKFHTLFDNQDKATCDSAYYLFENFYSEVRNEIGELHSEDTTNYDSLVLVYDEPIKLSAKLQNYTTKLNKNGFQVSMTEGITYIQEDRDFIKENLYKNLSPLMIKYLEQLNEENKEQFWDDGGIIIGSNTLIDRIIWWENFNKENPDFIFKQNRYQRQSMYTNSLITGEDNTPLYYHDEGQLYSYFKNAYDYLLIKYPTSETAKLLKPYYASLIKMDRAAIKKFQEANLK